MTVSDPATEYRSTTSPPARRSHVTTIRNGLVGGVVAVLLSFLPLSTVLGGGVAGYLERGAGRRGTVAGAIAGSVAAVPYLLIGTYLALSPTFVLPGPDLALSPTLVIAGVTLFALVYAVGLSLLGSVIGSSWRAERRE